MRTIPVVALILTGRIALLGQGLDTRQVLALLRDTTSACEGAEDEVQQGIHNNLRAKLWGSTIKATAATIQSFGEMTGHLFYPGGWQNASGGWSKRAYPPDEKYMDEFRWLFRPPYKLSWGEMEAASNRFGFSIPIGPNDGPGDTPIPNRKRIVFLHQLPGGKEYLIDAMIRKDALTDLRIGNKVNVEFQVSGLSGRLDSQIVISGHVTRVATATRLLKCKQGHEYDPASGYTFCPTDGTAVK